MSVGPHFQPAFQNLVQMPTILADLWPQKCDFQYGGRRNLEYSRILEF